MRAGWEIATHRITRQDLPHQAACHPCQVPAPHAETVGGCEERKAGEHDRRQVAIQAPQARNGSQYVGAATPAQEGERLNQKAAAAAGWIQDLGETARRGVGERNGLFDQQTRHRWRGVEGALGLAAGCLPCEDLLLVDPTEDVGINRRPIDPNCMSVRNRSGPELRGY